MLYYIIYIYIRNNHSTLSPTGAPDDGLYNPNPGVSNIL